MSGAQPQQPGTRVGTRPAGTAPVTSAPATTPADLAAETSSAAADPPRLGRPFAAQLTSSGLANLGDGVLQVGVPLVAITLTRSPGTIGLLTAAGWLPWLLLGLVAGVLVDRRDRRRTQVLGLALRAAVLAVGLALTLADALAIPVLVALVLAYGATEVVVDLAASAIVPDLVPRDRLHAANGRLLAVQQVTNSFVGAPIAGVLVTVGAGWVFGLPAALAALAALLLVRALPGGRDRYRHAAAEPGRALTEVREGVGFLVRHRVLGPVTLSGGVLNMVSTAYSTVFVLWAVGPGSAMGLSPAQFPLLTAAMAVGAVAGSLLVERLQRRVAEVPLMLVAWAVSGALLLVPAVLPTLTAALVAFVLIGVTNTVGNVVSQAMRQRLVPAAMLGRVSGAGRTLAYGLMPVGAVLGGLAAEVWGLQPVLVTAVVVAVAVVGYPVTVVRTRDVIAAEQAPD